MNLTNPAIARSRLGWLMEHMEPMQAIANSKTGRVELRGPDGQPIAVEAWPRDVREFLRRYRNRFAHGHIRVKRDGTVIVHVDEGGHHRRWTYTPQKFGQLLERVAEAIYGRLGIRIDASVTCNTCGACVGSNDTLTCGHADYSARPPRDGTVTLYEPPGATLRIEVLPMGDKGRGDHTVAELPGVHQPSRWLMTFLDSMAEDDSAVMRRSPTKCPCGNQASPADGYCRKCRPAS